MRFAYFAFVIVLLTGCGKSEPPLSGGKPVAAWLEAIKDRDPKARKQAVLKLGNAAPTDPSIFPALLEALKDPDAGVRAEVVVALLKCEANAQEAVTPLTQASKKDPDARVREFAAKALRKIEQRE